MEAKKVSDSYSSWIEEISHNALLPPRVQINKIAMAGFLTRFPLEMSSHLLMRQ